MSPQVATIVTPTRSQIQNWQTSHLETAATQWEAAADKSERVFVQHVESVKAPGGTQWMGTAADSAYDTAREAQDAVRAQSTLKRDCAQIARRGADDIRGAQRVAVEAISEAEDKGFKVSEDLSVTDTRGVGDSTNSGRKTTARQLSEFIRWRAEHLAQTDARVAEELNGKAAELDSRRIARGPSTTHLFDDKTSADGELPLYGPDGKPHPGDVIQRDVGDCYFEAAEIAVADKEPDHIKGMITKVGGDYYVSGMQDRYGNPIENYRITEKDLQAVLSHHPDQQVLWPAVLEAAAAKTRGGGDVEYGLKIMGDGDMPGTGLKQLTGHASYSWFPGGGHDEDELIKALNSGKPVVMGTSLSATPIGVDPHRDGLAAAHVYALSSAHRDPDGTVWAEIINPWQLNLPQGDSGPPVIRIDPSTPGRAWLNLSGALSHHGVTAFVEGG